MVAKSAVHERPSLPSTLLGQEALLESLRTINLEFLTLMSELAQASTYHSHDVLGNLSPFFRDLTPQSAAHAARFPFLLLDLHFSEPSWWNSEDMSRRSSVKDACKVPKAISAGATPIARSALILAWHAVRTERDASLVLLGLSSTSADALETMTLHELEGVALMEPTSIRPRWNNSPALWMQLLQRPQTSHLNVARDFVVHALQLTASAHLR
jgi:hypothetical protein